LEIVEKINESSMYEKKTKKDFRFFLFSNLQYTEYKVYYDYRISYIIITFIFSFIKIITISVIPLKKNYY